MSALIKQSADARTTTLIWGPFPTPLSTEDAALVAKVMARAIGLGYPTMKQTTPFSITISAVLSAPERH